MTHPVPLHRPGKENQSARPAKTPYPRPRQLRRRDSAALHSVQSQLSSQSAACSGARSAAPECASPAASAERLDIYRNEAAQIKELRHDKERIIAYVTARQNGIAPEMARQAAPYGLHFLRSDRDQRMKTQALLVEYGVPPAPLCWPRYELQLPGRLQDCPLLGHGRFNKVYDLRLNGKEYAFRPFVRLADRSPGQSPVSLAGEVLGIKPEQFHPALRSIAAARIADSLGLLGEDGIINPVCVAVVNGVPGTMSARIRGRNEGHGNFWNKAMPSESREVKHLNAVLKEVKAATPEKGQEVARALGLSRVNVDEDGTVRLTGSTGKRNRKAARRYASPSYNLSMAKLQVLAWLINLADIHPGNIMYEKKPGEQWRAKLVDLDEALAGIEPSQLQFRHEHDSWILADLSLPPVFLPADVRGQLQSQRCIEMNECLREELQAWLPQESLAGFLRREEQLRASALPDFPATAVWEEDDDLRPDQLQLDRVVGMSVHAFGDSEDSTSWDELNPPDARQLR